MNMKKTIVGIAVIAMGVSANAAGQRFTREELAYMPATTQIELFQQGLLTPSEVLEAQISRVKEFNGEYNADRRDLVKELDTFNAGKVNAITFDCFAEARKMAKEAERRYRDGTARRLEGVTVGVKDDCDVKGWRTDTGSLFKKDIEPSEADEDFVARLRAEGAIFLFQTTVPEFCASCMTWSRLYGVTRNPWNLPYGVGGSSGGSAAAVASGFCTLATGSDMAGSIRIPASMNGVWGFKSPLGRVPCGESMYMGYGPLARTFGDMVLMQDVLAGPSDGVHCSIRPKLEYPAHYAPIRGEKVAVAYMKDWLPGGIDADETAALDRTVEALERAGAEVVKVDLGWTAKGTMRTIVRGLTADAGAAQLEAMKAHPELLCANLAAFFDNTKGLDLEAIHEAQDLRGALNRELQEQVFRKGCIALVMPTLATAHVPADVEATPEKRADVNGKPFDSGVVTLTPAFNLMNNYPIVTVPAGFSSRNVPIGVQVIGNTFDDIASLRVSAALSKTLKPNFRDGRFPDFRNQK